MFLSVLYSLPIVEVLNLDYKLKLDNENRKKTEYAYFVLEILNELVHDFRQLSLVLGL